MRLGIDVHAAEQDGSGNCTYIRGLIRALLAIDPENEYVLYAVNPRHPFFAELPRRAGVRVVKTGPRAPVLRIPIFLAAASIRDRLDILHVQYIGAGWWRRSTTWDFCGSPHRSPGFSTGGPKSSSGGRPAGPGASSSVRNVREGI
jgi:hypothetical protein